MCISNILPWNKCERHKSAIWTVCPGVLIASLVEKNPAQKRIYLTEIEPNLYKSS